MLLGTYYHTLESKGRVSLPKTFRLVAQEWVLTRGLDGGIWGITPETFKERLEPYQTRTLTEKRIRDFMRVMAHEAVVSTVDAQGRIQLPELLIARAKLTKHAVIVGSFSYFEVWDREIYHQYRDQIDNQAELLAEGLNQTEREIV